ncbi:Membrane protein [Pseudomonas syringae pv. solidagae]|nr:Membrane protein [Pseudomonas syringae pv. solidagae]
MISGLAARNACGSAYACAASSAICTISSSPMQPELTLLINSTSESFMGAILIAGKKRGAKDNGKSIAPLCVHALRSMHSPSGPGWLHAHFGQLLDGDGRAHCLSGAQCSDALGIGGMRVRALTDQVIDYLVAVEHRRHHQCGTAISRGTVYIGTRLDQQPDHCQIALERCAGDGALAIIVADFRISLVVQQHTDRIRMAVIAGQHQQRIALVVAQICRQALFKQTLEHDGIPLASHIEYLLGELGSFVFSHGFRSADICIGH